MIYDLARLPLVFRLLASVPQLNIGTTEFDPNFKSGSIEDWALRLAAALVNSVDSTNRARSDNAERMAREIAARTAFEPLVAQVRSTAVYPRLAVLAPDHGRRDAALERLRSLGATAMYPTALNRIGALRPDLVGEVSAPGAEEFCRRLLTLPVHRGIGGHRRDKIVRILQEMS
jgi:dTDP-4-amino-4,6-dideoxygalactose transaminase